MAAELRAKCISNPRFLTNRVGRPVRITTNYLFSPKKASVQSTPAAIRHRPQHRALRRQTAETGEFVDLAFYIGLQQAFEIAEPLNALWPGEHFVKGGEGAM